MTTIRHILVSGLTFVLRLALTVGLIYGFLCIVGEADPWTVEAQIKLFIKGILIIGICALVIGITEHIKEDE
jgi:hypothetical protein